MKAVASFTLENSLIIDDGERPLQQSEDGQLTLNLNGYYIIHREQMNAFCEGFMAAQAIRYEQAVAGGVKP